MKTHPKPTFILILTASIIPACAAAPTTNPEPYPPIEISYTPAPTFTPSPSPIPTEPTPPIEISNTPSLTLTPSPFPTPTHTPTPTITPFPPANTFTEACDCTATPTLTIEVTKPPTGELSGAHVYGTVTSPTGQGIEGVQIYYALSAAPYRDLLAVTNAQGQYDGFIGIPHVETVRVWADYAGYTFKPGTGSKSWYNGEFGWISYGHYENVSLNFIGTPQ